MEFAPKTQDMSDKEKQPSSLEEFARQAAARLQSGEELFMEDYNS